MMMERFLVLFVSLLITSLALGQLDTFSKGSGASLRMHEIYETTNWDLLEDLYLYHNAIRYFHEANGLKFNRTVSFDKR